MQLAQKFGKVWLCGFLDVLAYRHAYRETSSHSNTLHTSQAEVTKASNVLMQLNRFESCVEVSFDTLQVGLLPACL